VSPSRVPVGPWRLVQFPPQQVGGQQRCWVVSVGAVWMSQARAQLSPGLSGRESCCATLKASAIREAAELSRRLACSAVRNAVAMLALGASRNQ